VERAGLGRAPFRFLSLERRPRGSGALCASCGRAIQRLYWVADANGTQFKVGSECIKKAEPYGPLSRAAEAALKEAEKMEKQERIAATKALLAADPTIIAEQLHWSNREDGTKRTLREWAEFALAYGGVKKQLEVCRIVEARAAERQESQN
jgi:hypothetical protein